MKQWIFSIFSLLALPSMAAEITSPFYMPQMGHIWGKTEAVYTKDKVKFQKTTRLYDQTLSQKLSLGLGAGLAALVEGNVDWLKQKQGTTHVYPRTEQYALGMRGVWNFDAFLMQVSGLYRQASNADFFAHRQIEAHFRLGKQLKTMTPYLHLTGNFPLNAHPDVSDPVYRGETGVFQMINDKMSLDSALFLRYDKNIKGRSYGIRSEISYLLTDGIAFSLNGEWQARGHAKNNAHTYHQQVGANIRFSF